MRIELELYEGHFEIRICRMEGWEMKLLTQVLAPFPELHYMQYNAWSSRVQERQQEHIAGLAKMSFASIAMMICQN